MENKELTIQRQVHKLMSDPSTIHKTTTRKHLQFLSPGYINKEQGPDFKDVAILLNGSVIICDCEFHKKASDWLLHNHNDDPLYSNVGLHIVLQNDTRIEQNFETLVLNPEQLPEVGVEKFDFEPNEYIDSLEEIQNFALLRLLRKTSEAKVLVNNLPFKKAFESSLRKFLQKYSTRKRRPVYKVESLEELISVLSNSQMFDFLLEIQNNTATNIPEKMFQLMKLRFYKEGNHMRRELILNCLLPLALAIANEEQRINLFVWFWSTPALNSYGILTRKFKNLPQNFIWQQQGMLEILNTYQKSTKTKSKNLLKIGEVLNFFYIGAPPFS